MIPKESRNQIALDKFLAANPDLKTEISGLSEREQQQQVQWAFEDEAQQQGIEAWELALELVAETPEELKLMRLEVHHEAAEALGMEWDEYRTLNELED